MLENKTENPRKPFEGMLNIVRFNWHFYVLVLVIVLLVVISTFSGFFPIIFRGLLILGAVIAVCYLIISLFISHIIYDRSDLYRFEWIKKLSLPDEGNFINIHSGFDETSLPLKSLFKNINWKILDFYDPEIHTEISIARARKYMPILPETIPVHYKEWNITPNSIDVCFGLLAVHEIRKHYEKVLFFKQAFIALKPGGKFILVEHLRNSANFLAYGPGFFHFFSEKIWKNAFTESGFQVTNEFQVTPFVKIFTLEKR